MPGLGGTGLDMTDVLLGVAIALLVVLIVLTLRRKDVSPGEIEAAVSGSWLKLGLGERIGAVEEQARAIQESYRSFEQLLRVPTQRGAFGELALETILSDQLPPEMYSLRQRTFDGKVPDATIRSTVGVICIDSKFPLDNYRRMLDSEDEDAARTCRARFLRDVRSHLGKIAADYIRPAKGSAEFAFAYIPAESVYYYLVEEAQDMLRDFARMGVQVVSPLTLTTRIELIKAGVYARRLSEEAERVQRDLQTLAGQFAALDEAWQVLYGTHLRNVATRSEDVDRAYAALRQEFERIASIKGPQEPHHS